MSAEDQNAAKAAMVLQYAELNDRRAVLRYRINGIANALERGAKLLKNQPEAFDFGGEDEPLGNYRDLKKLTDDFRETLEELQRLYALAVQGGFAHLLPALNCGEKF